MGACLGVTMMADVLGVYLYAVGRGDQMAVSQELWAAVNAEHRGFLQRTLSDCASSFRDFSRLNSSLQIEPNLVSLIEASRHTLEKLSTILFSR